MTPSERGERLEDVLMVIGGERVPAGGWIDDVDPSFGSVLCRVAAGTESDVDAAVDAATAAAPAWAALAPAERGKVLRAIADRVRAEAEQLALLECRDTGKPLSQARADIAVTARYFDFYGGAIEAQAGESIPLGAGLLAVTEHVPYGVTGHIVPWNYPAQITARSVAPSLAVGNALVVKPAEDAPLTPVRIGELALAAGLPAGVLNVVPGAGAVAGDALARHPGIGHVSFTGSVATGRAVAVRCAERGRPSTLELGGKSPHVVMADADLDRAIPLIVQTLIQNAGQTCVAGTRAIVHESLRAELVERLADTLSAVTIGPGIDDPQLGPLISARQLERVRGFAERATAAGLSDLIGRPPPEGLAGFYAPPMLFDGVDPASELAQQEVFGPVLAVLPFGEVDEAVALANGTDYGLTAAVWSRDIDTALSVAQRIEAGQVFVNGYVAGGGVELPFGGFKSSGYGREKGVEALREYGQTRTIAVRVDG